MLLLAAGARPLSAQVEKLSKPALESYRQRIPEAVKDANSLALKQYLGSLGASKAPVEAANAVRVADDLRDAKAVADDCAYYVVPAMSDIPRLPQVYPADGILGGELRIVAAQDEFEPASFVVFPFKDIAKAELKVSALTGPKGARLPKENVDLKVVKVWYQNGNGWFSYFADPGLELVPELLLNDENLVKVDTAAKANYARVDYPGGSKYVWISAPRRLEAGAFRPVEEPFADAKTLQPVAFKAGEFKQFFLTVCVPTKAAEGVYRGKVELVAGGKRIAEIPVALRVLPFELPLPKTFYDLHKDFVVSVMGNFTVRALMARNGNDRDLAERQQVAKLKNLRNHGIFHPTVVEQTPKTFALLKSLDIPTKPMWGHASLPNVEKHGGGRLSFDEMMAAKAAAKKCSEFYMKSLGHNDVFVTYSDEPSASYVVMVRGMVKYFHEYGIRFGISGHEGLLYKGGYTMGIHPFGGYPDDVERIRPWNIIGDKYVGFYAGQHHGAENPSFVRRQHGMLSYLSNCSMIDNYEFGDGWNDRAWDLYKPMALAYMTRGGLVDTLAWEGFREGIDDMRYATKLLQLAEEAIASGNVDRMLQGRKVRQYMAMLDGAKMELNEVRAEMIDHILKLNSMR